MKDYVKNSIFGSIVVQLVTLFINVYGLSLTVAPSDYVLQEILGLETLVQIIELGFYGWYANRVTEKLNDVAKYRYYDWMLTTPIMLFTTMAFYQYLFRKDEEEKEEKDDKKPPMTLRGFLTDNSFTITLVFLLNAVMLIVGFMGEVGALSTISSSVLGYAALLGSFGLIFKEFVGKVNWGRQGIFWFMFFFWSLYGVAALLENHAKNVSYNVLDLFAKNFYGLYLSWYINTVRVS